MRSFRWIVLLAIWSLPALADEPIVLLPADPAEVVVTGMITPASVDEFWAALAARPAASRVRLNSGGGQVWAILTIAEYIHYRGMATVIDADAVCYSGCAHLFFAGVERSIAPGGQLGMHQNFVPDDESGVADATRADMFDQLRRFGVSDPVISAWLRTPNSDNRIFTPAELIAWGIVTPQRPASPAVQ